MKKRTRKQIAGALAICIMMAAPANLCSVEAASSLQGDVLPLICEEEDAENESVEESVSETVESETEESETEESETEESETEESETVCNETESSDENSSSTVEGDEQTESESENQRPDTDKSGAFDRIYRDSGSSFVLTEITNDGVLDYRTYFQGDQKPKIRIEMDRNILCTASGGGLTEPKDSSCAENNPGCGFGQYDPKVTYIIKFDDSNILCLKRILMTIHKYGTATFCAELDFQILVPVMLSAQINDPQHIVQQLSRRPHKGHTLQILLFAGALPHEHNIRSFLTHTEYHMMPLLAQAAFGAGMAGLF